MTSETKKAVLYRMMTPDHQCPFGLKTLDLLRRSGYEVEDHHLASREEIDAFKKQHDVKTTPQTFVNEKRIGGYEDVRNYLGKPLKDPNATSYRPVAALFAMTALSAFTLNYGFNDSWISMQAVEWFIALSMVVLALLKLQDVESFSNMFVNYDLVARKWVPYSYIYPYAEGLAGVLMVGGLLNWLSIPIALFIGTVGAFSVFKAVYIDKRELKCACVGGANKVPLGFVSLTENLMMMAMALWMWFNHGWF
ncbi:MULTISPECIES: MauE/DoxX family redox-associated membrane protein [Gammaproteobacteria]|uniref:MauE/DoxX family redox-associated membrane protein n=1 Tax=Gammaproteobacteria TaxID=1236 RepID=UPI000DD058EC|nr:MULTISPECIES: glutaredoxin [Gammaproteobacteria]RTE87069.1 glutaredoxin [Aliidiomarina sp. B3213]TCZ93141.1 glutaredoxin [Lysobacter sp. N42]